MYACIILNISSEDKAKKSARAQAAAAASVAPTAAASATAVSTTNVDQLVEDLLVAPAPKLVQEAGVSYAASPDRSGASGSGAAASSGGGSGGPALSTIASVSLEERLKTLKISAQVCEIHIVSQAAEKYTKGTQTDGDPEWAVSTQTAPATENGRQSRAGSSTSQADGEGGLATGEDAADAEADAATEADAEEEEKVQVKELSPEDISNIMSGRDFGDFFNKSVRVTERAVLANSKFDVLVEYGENTTGGMDDGSDKLSHNFDFVSERWCAGRSVTKLAWSPNNPELLLSCYSAPSGIPAAEVDWASAKADPDGLLLVWSIMNQAAPEYVFTAQAPVLTGMFHPFSPNLLLGSTYSGQICLWDIRARRSPIQKTQLSAAGHTHPVYSMQVVGTQNAHSLVTISTNGKLCLWDTTQLVTPTDTITLKMEPGTSSGGTNAGSAANSKSSDSEVAVTTCAFAHGETNSFYVGAETGTVYNVEMHGSQPGVQNAHAAHHALVSSMQFHPQTDVRGSASDVLLTSSFDWTLKLWNLKRSPDKPLHTFSASSDYIFDAQWSPVHPSVLVSGDGGGNVDIWDLCTDMEVPLHRWNAEKGGRSSAVSSLAWTGDGNGVAAGFADGRISMLDVSPTVAQPGPNAHPAFSELLSTLPLEDYGVEGIDGDEYQP